MGHRFVGGGCDFVDEPDAKRHVRAEALAGEEPAPCCARADSREDEGRDDGGDDPELDLGEAEDRVVARERDVGAGDQAGAAAERIALDARNDRGGAP